MPEPRLLLKLVTRIAAFPILESRGSVPAVFTFKAKTSFFSFHHLEDLESYHCRLFGRGQGNAYCEATGSDELEVGMWGNRGVLTQQEL